MRVFGHCTAGRIASKTVCYHIMMAKWPILWVLQLLDDQMFSKMHWTEQLTPIFQRVKEMRELCLEPIEMSLLEVGILQKARAAYETGTVATSGLPFQALARHHFTIYPCQPLRLSKIILATEKLESLCTQSFTCEAFFDGNSVLINAYLICLFHKFFMQHPTMITTSYI